MKIKITTKLDKMALWYDYTIVCDDMKMATIPVDDKGRVKRAIELTNPIEYTRDELLKKYDRNAVVIKWEHTFTEAGEPAMAVVLGKDEAGE